MSKDHLDWIWYGVEGHEQILSFGRWQTHPCQRRYKLAEIQATEHDHPKKSIIGKCGHCGASPWTEGEMPPCSDSECTFPYWEPLKAQPITWSDVCAPIIARFEVGANFGADVVHKPKGAAAIAEILKIMAQKLDTEIAARRALTDLIPPEDIKKQGPE